MLRFSALVRPSFKFWLPSLSSPVYSPITSSIYSALTGPTFSVHRWLGVKDSALHLLITLFMTMLKISLTSKMHKEKMKLFKEDKDLKKNMDLKKEMLQTGT